MKRNTIFPTFALLLMVYTLIFPLECCFYVSKALDICIKSLIPSLFPFILLVKLYCATKDISSKSSLISNIFSKITGIPPVLSSIVLIGMFSGFPTGALAASSVYENNLCTKSDAERAIALSNNCSAAFLINAAGAKILHNTAFGYILLLSQCVSLIVCALLLKVIFPKKTVSGDVIYYSNQNAKQSISNKSFTSVFTKCIKDSINSVLGVSAYVMFFSLISGILSDMLFAIHDTPTFSMIISGIFEVSGAVFKATELSFPRNLLMCSFVCSLSGLAVFFQVSDVCCKYKLSTKQFVVSRLMCAFISPFICGVILCVLPKLRMFLYTERIEFSSCVYTVTSLVLVYLIIKIIANVKVNKIRRI